MQNHSESWPENSNISQWQIEYFHRDNPGKHFPNFAISASLDEKIIARLLNISEPYTDKDIWSYIYDNGRDVGQHEELGLEASLSECGLDVDGHACIWTTHLGNLDDMPEFRLIDLFEVLEYIYLPSTSDLYIFQQDLEWCFALPHDGWQFSRLWCSGI